VTIRDALTDLQTAALALHDAGFSKRAIAAHLHVGDADALIRRAKDKVALAERRAVLVKPAGYFEWHRD